MKYASLLAALAASYNLCTASTLIIPRDGNAEEYVAAGLAAGIQSSRRAIPNSPTGGYAPGKVNCPSERPTIRSATSVSDSEGSWLEMRRNNTFAPMREFLSRANISGFDTTNYINSYANNATALPNIGIAISGGGYRALLNGAGFVAAADNRTTNSSSTGHIGGLLQAATYLAGLSGGGWLVGSLYSNNFSTVESLRDGSSGSAIWKFDRSILEGPQSSGISILNTAQYYVDLQDAVDAKSQAGYATTLTDYWGRALSYQLINDTDGGPAYTFSSFALASNFQTGDTPMPILVIDERAPGTTVISLNSTVYEVNPFELGSWDPTTYAFAPLQYIGSNFSGGVLAANESCVSGFDNAGFIMGTSSTLFNQLILQLNSTSIPGAFRNIIAGILTTLSQDKQDIAQFNPNPFFGFNGNTNRNAQTEELDLVDGGEDLQNIPLNPLIQPPRAVDVIFAVDSSADTTENWPNGTSLQATYERSLNATIENGTSFPSIPDVNTFVNLGLNTQPTFFGCNATNTTNLTPLIVYIPNAPYIFHSNISTFTLTYNDTFRDLMIQNGYDGATQGNGTLDSQWHTCVSCAILSRSFHKTNTKVPDACQACFDKYCWNGTTNATTPDNYTPAFKIGAVPVSGAGRAYFSASVAGLVGLMAAFLVM